MRRFLSIYLFFIFSFMAVANDSTDGEIAKKACLQQTEQQNWDKALIDCTKASEEDSAAAATILGRIYEKGLHGKADLKQARYWYEQATEGGSKNAAYRLAVLWLTPDKGLGFEPQKAAYYLEKAYENGHVKAGLALAALLRKGQHIPQNNAAAFRIYENLSTQSREANYQSGKMLMSGQGVEQNEQKAFQYYHIAASAGHRDAQRDLGLSYFEGLGVEKSLINAYKWLDIASFQGDMEAAGALRLVEESISEDEAASARKAARNWLCQNKKGISGCP